jgi:adenylate kinase
MNRGILLFGFPGCGKGTQGKILGSMPGFHHVATGDIFRGLSPSHPLAAEVQRYVRAGDLVPDQLVLSLFATHVADLRLKDDDFLVTDGVPRNRRQVEFVNDALDVVRIFMLTIEDENVVIDRMRKRAREQGRVDDMSAEVMRHRLDVYRQETETCLDAYPKTLITRIPGEQPVFDVHMDIIHALSKMRHVPFR